MNTEWPERKPGKSTSFTPRREPESARDRILLALELGRRGQLLRKLGEEARRKALPESTEQSVDDSSAS